MFKKFLEWPVCLCLILVTAYMYNATPRQCGNSKGITYSGTKVCAGRTLAVSHDLKYLMGKWVRLKGLGTFKVEDLMHKKHRRAVDVYSPSIRKAKRFDPHKVELTVIRKKKL